MQRDKVGKIVSIGNGLCRVIVRSERLAGELAKLPGVEVRADDAERLGWWIIFPEALRPLIEPVFRPQRKDIIFTEPEPEQMSLLDGLPGMSEQTNASGDVEGGAEGRTSDEGDTTGGADTSRR